MSCMAKSLSAGPSEGSSMDLAISWEYNRSLEPTLPAIIFICDVFCVSLLEQDHQEGAGVRECYKNATQLCTRTLQDVRDV